MKLSEEIIDDVTVIHLAGSLTQDGTPILEKRFNQLAKVKGAPRGRRCRQGRCDHHAGDHRLSVSPSALEAAGGKLVFANVKGITGDIFARCRLDVIFTMAGNVAAAVKVARRGRSNPSIPPF